MYLEEHGAKPFGFKILALFFLFYSFDCSLLFLSLALLSFFFLSLRFLSSLSLFFLFFLFFFSFFSL